MSDFVSVSHIPLHLPQYPLIGAVLTYMLNNDIEYATSAFWQVLFQSQFRLEEGWSAICEQPPDDGRNAVDIIPHAYHPQSPHLLFKTSVNELKRPSYSKDKLIDQTKGYALKAVAKSQEHYILASSIRGPEFMPWVFWRSTGTLEPFFREWPTFIPIHKPQGVLFYRYIDAHKDPDPSNMESYRQIPADVFSVMAGTQCPPSSSNQPGPGTAQPPPQNLSQEQDETSPATQVEEGEPGQGEEGELGQGEEGEEVVSGSAQSHEKRGIKVRIHYEQHRFLSDRYWFTNRRRERVDTVRDDWKKEGHKHYRYRPDTRYWSETRPGS